MVHVRIGRNKVRAICRGSQRLWCPGGFTGRNQNDIYPFREGQSPNADGVRFWEGGGETRRSGERFYGHTGMEVSEWRREPASDGITVDRETPDGAIQARLAFWYCFGLLCRRNVRSIGQHFYRDTGRVAGRDSRHEPRAHASAAHAAHRGNGIT